MVDTTAPALPTRHDSIDSVTSYNSSIIDGNRSGVSTGRTTPEQVLSKGSGIGRGRSETVIYNPIKQTSPSGSSIQSPHNLKSVTTAGTIPCLPITQQTNIESSFEPAKKLGPYLRRSPSDLLFPIRRKSSSSTTQIPLNTLAAPTIPPPAALILETTSLALSRHTDFAISSLRASNINSSTDRRFPPTNEWGHPLDPLTRTYDVRNDVGRSTQELLARAPLSKGPHQTAMPKTRALEERVAIEKERVLREEEKLQIVKKELSDSAVALSKKNFGKSGK